MPNRLRLISLFLGLSVFAGCQTLYNPATGRQESLLFDTSREIALGVDIDKTVCAKYKIVNDPLMQSRLSRIGARVAGVSDRTDLAYVFRIVQDNELNAFSTPGGFVYVNTGLLANADDNELACVLGHEIGHIAARHSIKRLQAVLGYQMLMGIALGSRGNQDYTNTMDVIFNVISLGYSRQDEYLADDLAVRYALRAGYDPNGMISFFRKLKEKGGAGGKALHIPFLNSHPSIDARIQRIDARIHGAPQVSDR